MDPSDHQAIDTACRALIAAYAVAVDRGDGAAMAALFAPDGVLQRGDTVLRGAAEIPAIIGKRASDLVMRHHITTVAVTPRAISRAEAVAYYMVFNGRGAPLPLPMSLPFSIGEWHCAFAETPAGWRFARLEIRRNFLRDDSRPNDAGASASGR